MQKVLAAPVEGPAVMVRQGQEGAMALFQGQNPKVFGYKVGAKL